MYNFRCRTRIAGGFMIRDYVANQSKDNNKKAVTIVTANVYVYIFLYISINRFLLIRLYVRHIIDLG